MNESSVPTPAPTPLPPSPGPRRSVPPQPRCKPCQVETPRRRVVATALRELLQLSKSNVAFSVSSAVRDLATGVGQTQVRRPCFLGFFSAKFVFF